MKMGLVALTPEARGWYGNGVFACPRRTKESDGMKPRTDGPTKRGAGTGMASWRACLVVGAVLTVGCAASIEGGHFVKKDYKPRVMQAYAGEGDANPHVADHLLVNTTKGLAFLERDPDGTGIMLDTHWTDALGDHFAVWRPEGQAVEVFVPTDRTLPAFRFDYPHGYYELAGKVGVPKRPVPTVLVAAGTKLTPISAGSPVGSAR
jgi:hypothetical protein